MSKIDDDKLMIISPTGRCTFPTLFDRNPMRHAAYELAREDKRRFLYSSLFEDQKYSFSGPMPAGVYADIERNIIDQIAAAFAIPYEYVVGQMRSAYSYARYTLDANLRQAAQGWSAPYFAAEVISRPPKFAMRRTAGGWNALIIRDWIKENFKPALKRDLRWDSLPLHPDFHTDSERQMQMMLQRVFDPFGFGSIGQSVNGLYSESLRQAVSPTTRSPSPHHLNGRLGTPYLPPRKGKS